MNRQVVIIDNGGANLASLQFALQRLGSDAVVSADSALVGAATHVILPGVGAAADAMQRLRSRGLERTIARLTRPLLGICLGMQLLLESSDEENTACLGIIPGAARRLLNAPDRPVPHMGWNRLHHGGASALFKGVGSGEYAYFVHSYALPVGPATIATCDYGGEFSAAISHRNFHAVQFHPERSGPAGALILRNFLELY